MWVFKYVLKPFDGNYKLKVPVHSYVAGGTKTVPIEKYYITTQYSSYPSNYKENGEFVCKNDPYIPHNPDKKNWIWHDYKKNSTTQTDDLDSYVDSNGDIIITIPNNDCPPISLWLKDACGNNEFILLNPGLTEKLGTLTTCTDSRYSTADEKYGKRNQAVSWTFDNRVGINDSYKGSPNQDYPDNTTERKSDITFYKTNGSNIPYLKLTSIIDTCLYTSSSSGNGNLVTDPWNYSMKSKIIVWRSDQRPSQSDFYDTQITGSNWVSHKEAYVEDSGSSSFYLSNNFPVCDNTTHNTEKFELWYIIEDRVGNYEIYRINNKDYSSITNWLYDATAPLLSVSHAEKVNYIDDD